MRKTIVALQAARDPGAHIDVAQLCAGARLAAGHAGIARLALDVPADPAVYERFGRRPQQAPAFDVVAHAWHHGDDAPEVLLPGLAPVRAWQVHEEVAWDYERDWPDGVVSPGIKQISFVGKRPDLTDEEFARNYRGHVAVARVHHSLVWKYQQNVVERDSDDPVCAVSEFWFRSVEELTSRYYTFDDSSAVARADAATFLDPSTTTWMLVHEHWIAS